MILVFTVHPGAEHARHSGGIYGGRRSVRGRRSHAEDDTTGAGRWFVCTPDSIHFHPLSYAAVTIVTGGCIVRGHLSVSRALMKLSAVSPTQDAVTEMLLVGYADIAVTSPHSSFSALAAAAGGNTTQRVGKACGIHTRLLSQRKRQVPPPGEFPRG